MEEKTEEKKPLLVMELEQDVATAPMEKEEAIKEPERAKSTEPKAAYIGEWNRRTREMFTSPKIPKAGRRYCFKCVRFDGKRFYFQFDELHAR